MDTKTILLELRTQKGLSQDELAEKSLFQDKRYHVGKTVKPFQTRKH